MMTLSSLLPEFLHVYELPGKLDKILILIQSIGVELEIPHF